MPLGRWLDEPLPKHCDLTPPRRRPPEVDMEHEYLAAIDRDGLLGDSSSELRDTWLVPDCEEIEGHYRYGSPEFWEITRRSGNKDLLRRTNSWAIPNAAALDALADLGPLLELGAGGGYWAKLLRGRGVDVAAYDRSPPPAKGRKTGWAMRLWSPVEVGSIAQIERHPDHTLLLCWPSPGVDETCWAAEALAHHRSEHLAFIGEPDGGCTGSEAFHATLERDYELVKRVTIPRFSMVHDELFIYGR